MSYREWFQHAESYILQQLLSIFYQILKWIMSKLASREVLGKIILFVLELSSLKG